MSVVVFEDSGCNRLAPITYARTAFSIHCASMRLEDWLRHLNVEVATVVRPYLATLHEIDAPDFLRVRDLAKSSAHERPSLLLSGRIAPTRSNFEILQQLARDAKDPSVQTYLVTDREDVIAVVHPRSTWSDLDQSGFDGMDALLEKERVAATDVRDLSLRVFAFPHEVVACNMVALGENLEHRIQAGVATHALTETKEGVFVGTDARIGEYVLTDTSKGPIVIDAGAQIGPYTLLRGPLYVGCKSKILEHSAIKDAVTLCHTTKIGGEVEASVVEPFTNKQHHGFLGHSYLGSWINLGAGTCNSDLKNTYGTVNMEYSYGKSATNMQFLGCIMGDYSKTAINTGIFTGKVIGVCSMMYGFVTSNVPSFVNYARLFGQVAGLPPEVMVSTQQRMFARRNVEQRGCDTQLIYDLHRLTQFERDRLGDSLVGG